MMPPERPVGGAPGPHSVAARRGGRVAEGIIDGVRPLSAGLAAAALALALAACGGGRAVGAVPRPSTSTPTPTPTPACRSALAAGLHTLTLGGRSTLVEVPTGSGLHPLVLDLHGYGELATQQDSYTGLSGAGAAAGVVVLTPQALGTPPAWNFPQRTAVLPDDVAALTEEVDYAEAYLCADPDHVVATGYSDGADMADTLACARPGLVTAVVGVAPSVVPPGGCTGPVRVVEIHGTADPVVPYAGGGGERPAPFEGLEAQPVAARMAFWAQLDHCGTPPRELALAPDVQESRYPGCPVDLITELGAGHTWPGATRPRPEFGPTVEDFSATQLVIAVATGASAPLLGW